MSDWPTSERSSAAHRLIDNETYCRQIVEWLDARFPEVGAHPAAVSAVIQLHQMVGKGKLTRAEHGQRILAAVAEFDRRLGDVS